ncbi:Leucine-rich repeat [Trinorchestia longiramus]|nr:Leucine-rich repeat [Trinorchestia longiramus]
MCVGSRCNCESSIQNQYLCIATGCRKTTPITSLQIEADIPPLGLHREEIACRYYCRLLQLPLNVATSKLVQRLNTPLNWFFFPIAHLHHNCHRGVLGNEAADSAAKVAHLLRYRTLTPYSKEETAENVKFGCINVCGWKVGKFDDLAEEFEKGRLECVGAVETQMRDRVVSESEQELQMTLEIVDGYSRDFKIVIMHLYGFSRIGCLGRESHNPVSGLKLLWQVRCITTKQPTKATAAATKPDLYEEEFENKLSYPKLNEPEVDSSSRSSPNHKREKWQATTVKKWVKDEVQYPVHTCETRDEFYERKRVTFFRYAPDADNGASLPPGEKPNILQLFKRGKGLNLDNVEFMRKVLKVDVEALKEFSAEKLLESDTEDQMYRVERERMVGPELAAAHFIVFRGGRVRFHGHSEWVKKDENDEYNLPREKVDNLFVEDIDASSTDLLYEGLENFKGCQYLKSLNISRCKYADNFFLDRICLQHAHTLTSLNISHCNNISVGGITALCRLKKLQHLNVEGLFIPYLPLACLSLEDEIPGLQISGVSYILEELEMLPDDEIQLINSRLADVKNVFEVTNDKRK